MAARSRYSSDPQRIVHETIDGETIVIDLENGIYYSLTGSGPELWRLLLDGWTPAEAADAFGAPASDVETFVMALEDARLIGDDRAAAAPNGAPAPATPWEPAGFQTYTDMEYFLLLDPVHDVQEAGWPHAKPEALPERAVEQH